VCSDVTRLTALLHYARTCTAQSHNGRGISCLGKPCHGRWALQGAYTVCSGHGSQREAGAEVSELDGAVGTSSPQPLVVRTLALDRRRPPAGARMRASAC